tara:strand:- start:87569 stop:88084 length:516 start_codon:yes stop_codon:yes gene_type:complete
MLRFLVFLSLILGFNSTSTAQYDSDSIRTRFENATSENDFLWIVNSPTVASSLEDSVIITSYKAVSQSALAQYVFSPYTKLKYFWKGSKQLEACIIEDKNIESIYLRCVVQLSVPSFLGYSGDIENDLDYIKSNIQESTVSLQTKEFIIRTLINTGNEDYGLMELEKIELN